MLSSIPLETAALVFAGFIVGMLAPKRIALAAAILMCFVPVARAEIPLWGATIGVRPEDTLVAILAVRVALTRMLACPDSRKSPFFKWLAGLVALCCLSFLWAVTDWAIGRSLGDPPALYVAQRMIGSTVLVWVTWEICRTRSALRWVLGAAIAGGMIMFCLAFLGAGYQARTVGQSAAYYAEMYDVKARNVERLASWNPNVLGLSFGMLLIFVSAALTARPRFWCRVLLLGAGGVFAFGLVRSYTRTAIIGAAVAALYVVFRLVSFGYLKRTVVGLFVLGACAAGIVAYSVDANAFQIDFGQDLNTGSRMAVWAAGADLLLEHPLGFGLGRAEQALAQRMTFDSAHNDWLDFGLSIGLAGGLYAIFAFWRLYAECRAATRCASFKAPFILAESLMVYFFVASTALQVYTFQKQAFVGIAVLIAFIHLRPVRSAPVSAPGFDSARLFEPIRGSIAMPRTDPAMCRRMPCATGEGK